MILNTESSHLFWFNLIGNTFTDSEIRPDSERHWSFGVDEVEVTNSMKLLNRNYNFPSDILARSKMETICLYFAYAFFNGYDKEIGTSYKTKILEDCPISICPKGKMLPTQGTVNKKEEESFRWIIKYKVSLCVGYIVQNQ